MFNENTRIGAFVEIEDGDFLASSTWNSIPAWVRDTRSLYVGFTNVKSSVNTDISVELETTYSWITPTKLRKVKSWMWVLFVVVEFGLGPTP